MFWIILLCHFIADFPLQTDGMVVAKKTISGLVMHVAIHFITMIVMLFGVVNISAKYGILLALAVSLFHFGIDFWKNVLFKLKPDWVVISYIQDQILHLLSILFVTFIWQQFNDENMFSIENKIYVYATGLLLITHIWFVTERILSHQHLEYQGWVVAKIWPRMIFRALIYSTIWFGLSLTGICVFLVAFLVSWFDMTLKRLLIDSAGVFVLMLLTWLIVNYLPSPIF